MGSQHPPNQTGRPAHTKAQYGAKTPEQGSGKEQSCIQSLSPTGIRAQGPCRLVYHLLCTGLCSRFLRFTLTLCSWHSFFL